MIVDDVSVVRRGELTDEAWAVIAPLLPEPGSSRGRWRDPRQVINGILWKLRTGAPGRDLPDRFGPWKTCHERLRGWTADGTWDRILAAAQVHDDGTPVQWTISIDSSIVRAHQHAAGARKKGLPDKSGDAWCASWRGHRSIPRGLSTRIHLAVDGRGRPLSILLTPGQAGDNPQLLALLDAIAVNEPGPGRPRKRPDVLIADKGYAHDSTRRALRHRGIRHVVPERSDQVARRAAMGSAGGRPPAFDKAIYKKRNVVERCFNRLKQWRQPAVMRLSNENSIPPRLIDQHRGEVAYHRLTLRNAVDARIESEMSHGVGQAQLHQRRNIGQSRRPNR
ncbi:IS5 family transposase [Micromonospora sp. URMC 106]|uniref:IS5 family transposase n=1 Tax=Micromonospora sp. URMC 106 TaxID=3423408 RepID=UPI003F19BFDD